MTHIAMDVHKKRSVLAYQTPAMEEPEVVRCFTTRKELSEVFERMPRPWIVCLEATRQSPAVVRWLREWGADEIHLVDPKQMKPFVKGKPKSDARDAKEMLSLLQIGRLPEGYLAPEDVQELRALTRTRSYVRRGSTRLRNQLRTLLNHRGLEVMATDLCGVGGQQQLKACSAQLGVYGQMAVSQLNPLLLATEQALDVLDAATREELARQPIAQALMELPGIGPVIALALVAELGEIERFEDPEHLISYAGLAPLAHDSDDFQAPRHLPFRCNRRLRALATQASQAACHGNSDCKARRTYERLCARGLHPNTAKVAAARELLKDVFYCWKQAAASDLAAG